MLSLAGGSELAPRPINVLLMAAPKRAAASLDLGHWKVVNPTLGNHIIIVGLRAIWCIAYRSEQLGMGRAGPGESRVSSVWVLNGDDDSVLAISAHLYCIEGSVHLTITPSPAVLSLLATSPHCAECLIIVNRYQQFRARLHA